MNTTQIIPTRSARRQFQLAAANSVLIERAQNPEFYLVDGVGGPCYMVAAEYEHYKKLCAAWAEAGSDQHDAPGPLMFIVGSKTQADEIAEKRLKPLSYFKAAFREIQGILLGYNHALNEDERDDMIMTLCARIETVKVAVLRAEEIWADASYAKASEHTGGQSHECHD